jgi:hypothetical protein
MNPLRLVGLLMFSSVFVFYGYELYTQQAVKADAERRMLTLWNLAIQQYPVLGDYNALFSQHVGHVVIGLMYLFLSAPILVYCRWWALFEMPGWALWCALYYNPYVVFKNGDANEPLTASVTSLKNLAIFGGLLWRLSEYSEYKDKSGASKSKRRGNNK